MEIMNFHLNMLFMRFIDMLMGEGEGTSRRNKARARLKKGVKDIMTFVSCV